MVYTTLTSTSAEAPVSYAAPGDFAGEINIFICHENNIFCFSQIRGACGRKGAAIAMLLLPLKLRSGVDLLRFLRR